MIKTMRVVAKLPEIGVPFPGEKGKKVRSLPMRVPRSPYWLRYLEMGLVLEVPPGAVPAASMPMASAQEGDE